VTATATDPGKLGMLEQLGADAVVMDGLDGVSVGEAVAAARPDVIVHQMTAIAGRPNMRHLDRWFAITNRLRTEGTDHCSPRPRRPVYPTSSRRSTPAGTESARAAG
jgi:hypothetical protein